MAMVMVGELVMDLSLYPRERVNLYHVGEIVQAMQAGKEMPPVIAEQATMRVVDGFHRITATQRLHGAQAPIEVELRTYPDEAALFLEACRLNASHGLRMTAYDRAKALKMAGELKVDKTLLADALSMKQDAAESLVRRKSATDSLGAPILLKRSVEHLAGKQLTSQQSEGIKRAAGLPSGFWCRQLIEAAQMDTLDRENVALKEKIRELISVLTAWLGE